MFVKNLFNRFSGRQDLSVRLKHFNQPKSLGTPPATGRIFGIPFADSGAGAVNTTISLGTGSATFTRATSATCWSSSGLILTVGTGVARSSYTELTAAEYLGYWSEEARTNTCLWARDFTNAAWVKTTCTAALDQVGIDGAANTASSLLATAGNATVKQTLALAAVNRPFSVYIKRLVGTGNIDLAQDGATFTNQSVANDGLWHRCTLVASQLNPVLSIRIVTNADKIAVDYAGLEDASGGAATFPTTPILTTTVAVTRNADVLSYPTAGNLSGVAGTVFARVSFATVAGGVDVVSSFTGASGIPMGLGGGSGAVFLNDGASIVSTVTPGTSSATAVKIATKWSGVTANAYVNGSGGTPQVFDGDLGIAATMTIMNRTTGGSYPNGGIRDVNIWNAALTDSQIAGL